MAKVATFGPVLLEAWKKAAENNLRVSCGLGDEGRKKAIHLRYRLYMLRSALEREKHEVYEVAKRAKLSIFNDPAVGWIVTGLPADGDLEDLLQQSGVSVPAAPDLDL